ncbi:MAG: 50S ribosomal protein L10 [Thermoleophilia bacterium]|nr:50S ribosomal protein L10 [Thermoleophilia bacterium]
MNRKEKEARVAKLAELARGSAAMLLADYRGLSVVEAQELRNGIREAGASYEVVKNRLMILAAEEAGSGQIKELLEGPTAIAFCPEDAVGPAKSLVRYAKDFKPLEIKGGILEGKIVDAEKIKFLASLPAKEVLQAQLLGAMMGPVRGLATVCAGPIRGLVTVLTRIQEQKEEAA